MPIRFRCAYCNQLMGISRRKAGSVISCPKCKGQVIVPVPEGEEAPAPQPSEPPAAPGPDLFEHSDFGQMLGNPPPPVLPQPAPAPQPVPAPAQEPEIDVVPVAITQEASPPTPGLFLSPGKLAVVGVAIVLLLGGAFFLGLLIGWSSKT